MVFLALLLALAGSAMTAFTEEMQAMVQTEETNIGNCTEPYISLAGRCLFFESLTKGTWGNMKSICQLLDGELARVDTVEVISDIVAFINDHALPEENYWIGASDESKEGQWLWSDGTPVRMGIPCGITVGTDKEPNGGTNQNCAVLKSSVFYYINDEDCDGEYYGICESFGVGLGN